MLINGRDDIHEEGDKLEILRGSLARAEEIDARICSERPVIMLTRAVDTLERLLVQQHAEVAASLRLSYSSSFIKLITRAGIAPK